MMVLHGKIIMHYTLQINTIFSIWKVDTFLIYIVINNKYIWTI